MFIVSIWCCSPCTWEQNCSLRIRNEHNAICQKRQKETYFKHHGKSGAKCELIVAHRGDVKKFGNLWANWVLAEEVSCSGWANAVLFERRETSQHRKWVGRNYPFKLLPLLDFRETIMASDKLFGTQPNKIKNSFPSSCLPINFPPFHLSSSGDLCWFVRLGTAEGSTSD